MKYIIVDVESDGNILGTHSMVCLGAIVLDRELDKTFYGQTRPISEFYDPDALSISGFSREEHEKFEDPKEVFQKFKDWLDKVTQGDKVVLLSDNNGYDAPWINWYFLTYLGKNPFGWSSRRIGDWFCGYFNKPQYQWKKHRQTSHTHHPVDDSRGNAEAMLYLIDQGFALKI